MSIRFTITNRRNGELIRTEAPRRGEHVKDGKVTVLAPAKDACDAIKKLIADHSKLGGQGGIYA